MCRYCRSGIAAAHEAGKLPVKLVPSSMRIAIGRFTRIVPHPDWAGPVVGWQPQADAVMFILRINDLIMTSLVAIEQ